MLSLIPDGKGTLCELGAGWGTLAMPMAKRFKSSQVIAIELSPVPWLFMKLRQILFARPNLEIIRANFLTHPLPNDVRVVVFYMHPQMLTKARPVLERALSPGTLVISNVFEIPGWEPEAVHKLEDSFCPQVYVYHVPEQENLP
jgi:16S rRNA A1518/A1519 N6-dimethyltransferase RsmA/KsgA/DIM1 with predicted DNA glycosylase/AP lyase activity